MKSALKQLGKLFLLGIPLFLGIAGLMIAGESFLQAIFLSICMYLLGYQDLPPNILVEIARWIAPLATASSILLAIAAMRYRLHNYFVYLTGKCTAVYGPEGEKQTVLSQLGVHGIDGKDAFVKAQRYILLGDEKDNLEFYQKNRERLRNQTVYLKCHSIPAQASNDPNLRLFCPEETAARLFWKKHCLYDISAQHDHKISVVFLGFGKLGQELLVSALQNNLFSPDQHIAYHIFGDDAGFSDTHKELASISDPVVFHRDCWYTQLPLIEKAEAVIVLEQNDQLALLQELLLAVQAPQIYVFAADCMGLGILSERKRFTVFDWQAESQKLDNIFGDLLFERAKRINLRYAHLYSGVPEDAENKEKEWAKLSAFTRYSNISSADYHEVQRKVLSLCGQSTDISQLPDHWLELLAELEHIRWCRYHFLNNWKYGMPTNGKNKDAEHRIHTLLVPYDTLDDAEKEKDRENVRILFSIEA